MVVSVFCFLSYFGANNDILDLMSHFRLHFGLCLLVLTLLFCFRNWVLALAFGLMTLVAAVDSPLFFQSGKLVKETDSAQHLRILQMNLWAGNEKFDQIKKTIDSADADLVALEELSPEAQKWFQKSLKQSYPYQIMHTQPDNFGIGLLSRYKLHDALLFYVRKEKYLSPPMVTTNIEVKGRTVGVLVAHLIPPFGEPNFIMDKAMVESMISFCKKYDDKIVVGDLNLSQHSALFKKLIADTNLHDSARGFGWHPTFPSNTGMGIYIDQCLTGGAISVVDRKNGAAFGSDHFPVLIDLNVSSSSK